MRTQRAIRPSQSQRLSRRIGRGMALFGLLALARPAAADLTQGRLLHRFEPEGAALWEAQRLADDPAALGSLFPHSRADAAQLLAGARAPSGRIEAADAWLREARGATPLGLRLALDATGFLFAADPHRQLEPLFLDPRAGEAVDPALRARVGAWADAQLTPRLSAHFRFVLDSEGTNDTHNRTRDFKTFNASNNVDEAYLRYAGERIAFVVGRSFLQWGPERLGSLVLSATAPAPDMLHGELRLGRHRLQSFVAQLSSETLPRTVRLETPLPDGTTTLRLPTELQRHLYGHRLELVAASWLRLGISETVVVAEEGGGLNLKFLNPVHFFAQAQVEDDGGDNLEANVLNAIDGELWWRRWHLYGSFLVDDYQIDANQSDVYPNQLAWAAGADWNPLATSPWWFGYEYRRTGSWSYLHRGDGVDYQHYERPLGAPEGPDTDRHNLHAAWRPDARWHLWAQAERRRRGINDLFVEESREGHANGEFPRGPVEKRWIGVLGAELSLPPHARAQAQLAYHSIENLANAPGDEDVLEFRFVVQLFLPALQWTIDE